MAATFQIQKHLQRPTPINSIEVHGANNTRKGFLDPVFEPLVRDSQNVDTTLGDVLLRLQEATGKLERFGKTHAHLFSFTRGATVWHICSGSACNEFSS